MSSQGRSRKVLFMAFGAGGFLFALLGLNDVTGIWPQPWLFLEIVVALGSMLVMFQSIIIITYMHPIAPRGEARKWAWAGVSYRFWFLLFGMLLTPVRRGLEAVVRLGAPLGSVRNRECRHRVPRRQAVA